MIRSRLAGSSRWVLTIAALVVVFAAGEAQAAPPSGGVPNTGHGAPTPAAPAAGGQAGEEASNHFKRGLQLFDESDYTLALVEFERAYQLAPNYRALYNIALVNMQLGRYADAARTFEKYLHDGGDAIPPARLAEVKKALGDLTFRTATVDIATNVPSAEVTLDGKPVDAAGLHGPMEIDAGEHTVRATAPGFRAANRTVTLAGGDHASVHLDLVPLAPTRAGGESSGRVHTIFWPGFAATGALTAGAIVSGVVMLDARSHLSTLQNTPSDPSSAAGAATQRANFANRANTASLTADILTGLAVITGGVSLYLSVGPDHAPKSPSVAISPQRVSLSIPF